MTLQGFNSLIAADNPMVQWYNERSPHLAQWLDDAIDKYYNDKMSGKATMQIGK